MLNATSTRALLGALILVCAPAMAIIPPSVEIRLAGAQQVGAYAYSVHESDPVSLTVSAEPGSLIWAFAAAVGPNDEVDYSVVVTLMLDRDAKTGRISAALVVPKNLAGRTFAIEAISLSDSGEMSFSTTLIVSVLSAHSAQNATDPVLEQ